MASKLIHNMQDLNSCPYYWGNISRKEAWDVLEDKPLGSYLLQTCAVCRTHASTPKELSRAEICSSPITYEGITTLEIPEILKSFLRNFSY